MRDCGPPVVRASDPPRGHHWLSHLEKPFVAMIQGFCIGGGLAIALNADVRFATPGSRFGIPAAKLGLGYEYAGTAALARLVGPSSARDILFSAPRWAQRRSSHKGIAVPPLFNSTRWPICAGPPSPRAVASTAAP